MDLTNNILYEDNHFIVINKKNGVLVQGDATGDKSLVDLLKEYLKIKYNKPGNVFVGLPHRIDRPVSGCVLMTKTSKGLERANALFLNKQIKKTYHAIVSHCPEPPSATLTQYLKKIASDNFTKVYKTPTPNTQQAIMHYTLLHAIGKNYKLEIQLETGRHHQIRAQLSSIGSAIYGDLKYGSKFHLDRHSIALHAYSLVFNHPIKNEEIKVIAPFPEHDIWNEKNKT